MDPVTSNPQGARKRRFDRESSFLEWKPLRLEAGLWSLEWLFLCIIIVIGAFLACFPNTSSEVVCLLVIVIYSVRKCDKSRLHTERTNINTPMRWSYHSSTTSPPCFDRISLSHPNNSARRLQLRIPPSTATRRSDPSASAWSPVGSVDRVCLESAACMHANQTCA